MKSNVDPVSKKEILDLLKIPISYTRIKCALLPLDAIKEALENRDGIHLLVKDKEGKILGNILSLRQSQEYDNLLDHDADFTNDGNALYIESIAVKPKNRDLGVFNSLLKSLNKEAKKRNYKKITMHAKSLHRS